MRAKQYLTQQLIPMLSKMGLQWPEKTVVEPPRDKKFGDLAVNVALLLGKEAGKPPHELASDLATGLLRSAGQIDDAQVAGPGFLNITFKPSFWHTAIHEVEHFGPRYGASSMGKGKKIQVEFVSANPTGPLHIGHGRGAAIGDSLARVLAFAGFDVHTEYYINDAGRQMRLLGISVWLRVLELAGKKPQFPEDWYKGEYITDIAREMLEKEPGLAELPENEGTDRCFEYAMHSILEGIKKDLADFRVAHASWFSEKTLVASGAVQKTFARLAEAGHTYEHEGALWFRTQDLGDDKDRVLRKSDGTLTYFASDIAYHDNKYDRGFEMLVDIWGADHHGYIPRMRAAIEALHKPADSFDVILVQLVNLLRGGNKVSMSTRAGQFDTLEDVIKEVGTDAARFMFLSRKSDSQLDFDLDLVKQRTMDNPVYYVQYAYARVCAVLRKAAERGISLPSVSGADVLSPLCENEELDLLRRLDQFQDVVEGAASGLAPHHISYYLMELAGELHRYYSMHQALGANDDALVSARLLLLRSVGRVIANGLALLGVEAPESM